MSRLCERARVSKDRGLVRPPSDGSGVWYVDCFSGLAMSISTPGKPRNVSPVVVLMLTCALPACGSSVISRDRAGSLAGNSGTTNTGGAGGTGGAVGTGGSVAGIDGGVAGGGGGNAGAGGSAEGAGGGVGGSGGAGGIGGGMPTAGGGACAMRTPSPPALNGNAVHDTAVTEEFARIDQFLGRYLRGEVPTFMGPASVAETTGVFGTPGSISTPAAVAAVIIDGETATLTIADPVAHQREILTQSSASPGLTDASHVMPDLSYPGGPSGATCAGCAPDLFTLPSTIDLTGLNAHYPGQFRLDGEASIAPFDVSISATLRSLSPCALTWAQVVALNGGTSAFMQVGNEMVQHAGGFVQTRAPSTRACDGVAIPYHIDVYVNLSDLFDFGLRNFVTDDPQPVCGPA